MCLPVRHLTAVDILLVRNIGTRPAIFWNLFYRTPNDDRHQICCQNAKTYVMPLSSLPRLHKINTSSEGERVRLALHTPYTSQSMHLTGCLASENLSTNNLIHFRKSSDDTKRGKAFNCTLLIEIFRSVLIQSGSNVTEVFVF